MERFAWKGRIKPGMAEEYKRRHDNIWPEMKELLKQAMRLRHSLDAFEHVIRSGNAEALEDLIRSASQGRAGWQMGVARADDAGAAAPDAATPAGADAPATRQ